MPSVDKNQSVVNFLKTCPSLMNSPMFFNFGNVKDGATQTTIKSDDIIMHRPFIDGSVQKRYTFVIDCFKSVAYNPVFINTQQSPTSNENIDELNEVQAIVDWINDKGIQGQFPDFGTACIIEKMETLTSKPDLVGVDTSQNPPTAVYRISIQIDYIDTSNSIWN